MYTYHIPSCIRIMYGHDGLGGGNSNIFYFHHLLGEDEPILTHIFQLG